MPSWFVLFNSWSKFDLDLSGLLLRLLLSSGQRPRIPMLCRQILFCVERDKRLDLRSLSIWFLLHGSRVRARRMRGRHLLDN